MRPKPNRYMMDIMGTTHDNITSKVMEFIESNHGYVTKLAVDNLIDRLIKEAGYEAAFKNVPGYDFASCIAINNEVVHGMPNDTIIRDGDYVTIDFGIQDEAGWIVDSAEAWCVGAHRDPPIVKAARKVLDAAFRACEPGNKVTAVGKACTAVDQPFYLLPAFHGHGILPRRLHASPLIPSVPVGKIPTHDWEHMVLQQNYRFQVGDVVCVEPILSAYDDDEFDIGEDGWTVRMHNPNNLAVHIEFCVMITENGPIILA